jgi:DNA polymerase III epsilon subunit-like protein
MKRNRILVFDVETTGLLPKPDASGNAIPISKYPYVIQFSFIVFNKITKNIDRKHNYYIKVAPEIEIHERITEITGITREMCDSRGESICNALETFYDCYVLCDTVVAHNYAFDSVVLKTELNRNKEKISPCCQHLFNTMFDSEHSIESFCTMRYGTNICAITKEKENGKSYKKWPTLLELYRHLFESTPLNLHNSMVDVIACLRCYLKMRCRIELTEGEFQQLIHDI